MLAIRQNWPLSSGVSFPKGGNQGKLGLVELVGAGSTRRKDAPLMRYLCNIENVVKNKKMFYFKDFIDEPLCSYRIDTGSDVSVVSSKLVGNP